MHMSPLSPPSKCTGGLKNYNDLRRRRRRRRRKRGGEGRWGILLPFGVLVVYTYGTSCRTECHTPSPHTSLAILEVLYSTSYNMSYSECVPLLLPRPGRPCQISTIQVYSVLCCEPGVWPAWGLRTPEARASMLDLYNTSIQYIVL